MFKTVAWATDTSPSAGAAGAVAADLASATGAKVVVIHVTEVALGIAGAATSPNEAETAATLKRTLEDLRHSGVEAELVTARAPAGAAAPQITDLARRAGAEVLVSGTRGRGPVAGLLLGSVTLRLLQTAPCPVLVVPERGAGAP